MASDEAPNKVDIPSVNLIGQGQHSVLLYYLGILRRRIWIIVPLVVVAATLGLVAAFRTSRLYRAGARVLVERQVPTVMQFEASLRSGGAWDPEFYETQTELATSRAVLDLALESSEVRAQLDDAGHREADGRGPSLFTELKRSFLAALGGTPTAPPELWQQMRELVRATHVSDTHFIEIAATSVDPVRAAVLANGLARAFESYHRLQQEQVLGEAFRRLDREKRKEEAALLEAESALQAFRESERGINVTAPEETQPAQERLNRINAQLTDVQLRLIAVTSEVDVMRAALESDLFDSEGTRRTLYSLPVMKTDGTLVSVRADLADAERSLAVLSDTYGREHPLYQTALAKVELLREQFRTGLADVLRSEENRLRMLRDEEDELTKRYEVQKRQSVELARESFTLARLQNAVTRHRSLYDALVARMREVDVSSGLARTNIRLVERASIPTKPINVGTARRVLLSAVMGLILGVGLAFVFENLDDTVKTPEDLKERLPVPLLGFVPEIEPDADDTDLQGDAAARAGGGGIGALLSHARAGLRDRLFVLRPEWFAGRVAEPVKVPDAVRHRRATLVLNEPGSSVAEAYRGIRTSLFYSVPADTLKTLAVTSCRPQEGKTTTCANLALCIAQTAKRVLLIDGDLHRPMMHRSLGLDRARGLTSVLVGECTWQEALSRVPLGSDSDNHLDVLTAGPTTPNPSELLGSPRMRELIEAVKPHYDWVMIDTPPVLFVSDASVLSVLCDGVVVVVKAGGSTRTLLNRAREQLTGVHASILGTVLNSVVVSRIGRHSSSYYSYGYSRYAKDYKSLYYAVDAEEEPEPGSVAPETPSPSEPAVEPPEPSTTTETVKPVVSAGTAAPVKSAASAEPDRPVEGAEPVASKKLAGKHALRAPKLAPDVVSASDQGDGATGGSDSEPRHNPYGRRTKKIDRLIARDRLEEAREMADAILKLDPDCELLLEKQLEIAVKTGSSSQASQLGAGLLAKHPENAYALFIMGSLAIVERRYREARALLERSVARTRLPEATNNLAWLLKTTGKLDEAEVLAREALAADPKQHHMWDTLGMVLIERGQLPEAEEAFARALRLDADNLSACINAADVYARRGRKRRANRLLKRLDRQHDQLDAHERKRLKHIHRVVASL